MSGYITGTSLSEFTESFPIGKCCVSFHEIEHLKIPDLSKGTRLFWSLLHLLFCLDTSPALPSSSFLSLIGSHFTTQSLNLRQINLVIGSWDELETCP